MPEVAVGSNEPQSTKSTTVRTMDKPAGRFSMFLVKTGRLNKPELNEDLKPPPIADVAEQEEVKKDQ